MRLSLEWQKDLQFETVTEKGLRLNLDGNSGAAVSPTEALLGSLASCIAIDIVLILSRMRLQVEDLRADISAERADTPPRYFKKVELAFQVTGSAPDHQINRAVQLSVDKYCSVLHSLRPDLRLDWTVTRHGSGSS